MGCSQDYLRTNVRTLENWEQGRAKPNAQAALLIRMVQRYPDTVRRLVEICVGCRSRNSPMASTVGQPTLPRRQFHRNSCEAVMDVLSLLQWPAMVVTLVAAWLVASQSKTRRSWGFWTFIASNVLWILWGWHEQALALIVLQVGLFMLNLRGARKNDPETSGS